MKKYFVLLLIIFMLLTSSCSAKDMSYNIVATTLPVFDFTVSLCADTELTVGRLVTESVSCLHDYTLQVSQMRMIAGADSVVISGLGLEEFLNDALQSKHSIIDASTNTHIHHGNHVDHVHHGHSHHEESDPHIWLSPVNAKIMAQNICDGLEQAYPQYAETFRSNLKTLHSKLDILQQYGEKELNNLSCRELITFHDGFSYLAESFDLTILESIEEESGSEPSAAEIIHLLDLVQHHHLPAVFVESSGSDACAGIIAAETGVEIFTLDMAMAGNSYFDAMYHNINILKEAMG